MDVCELTLVTLVVLEGLHGQEAGTSGEELMGELSLVVRLVDLLVVVASLIWETRQQELQARQPWTSSPNPNILTEGWVGEFGSSFKKVSACSWI